METLEGNHFQVTEYRISESDNRNWGQYRVFTFDTINIILGTMYQQEDRLIYIYYIYD